MVYDTPKKKVEAFLICKDGGTVDVRGPVELGCTMLELDMDGG